MMYRARIDAVNGLRVLADGKWLICIGNAPVKVGDRVWTDGRCIYGNHRVSEQPIVITPQQEDVMVIPILFRDRYRPSSTAVRPDHVYLSSIKAKGALLPFETAQDFTPPAQSDYYFTAGKIKNKSAVVAVDVNATGISESYRGTCDNLFMSADGDIYRVCGYSVFKNNGTDSFYSGSRIVRSSGFYNHTYTDVFGNVVQGWAIAGNSWIDLAGNYYCLGLGFVEAVSVSVLHESTDGDTVLYSDYYDWFFIENNKVTLLYRVESTILNVGFGFKPFGIQSPDDVAIYVVGRQDIAKTWTPYSIYLPCQNGGKGGWYSFDCKFETGDLRDISGWLLTDHKRGYFCTGLKFFDAAKKELFALTDEDFSSIGLSIDGSAVLARGSDGRPLYTITSNKIPVIDFYQIRDDDFLILYNLEGRYGRVLRYQDKTLYEVDTGLDPRNLKYMFAICPFKKKKWKNAARTLAKSISDAPSIIIAQG